MEKFVLFFEKKTRIYQDVEVLISSAQWGKGCRQDSTFLIENYDRVF